jgi:hypothetical protein
MIRLEDRPARQFRTGERIRMVDDRGTAGFRKRNGIHEGGVYTVRTCWRKSVKQGRSFKYLVILEGYHDWVFSTRRFEPISHLPENLFTI